MVARVLFSLWIANSALILILCCWEQQAMPNPCWEQHARTNSSLVLSFSLGLTFYCFCVAESNRPAFSANIDLIICGIVSTIVHCRHFNAHISVIRASREDDTGWCRELYSNQHKPNVSDHYRISWTILPFSSDFAFLLIPHMTTRSHMSALHKFRAGLYY